MTTRLASILIAIFFCCPIVAVGQDPYPVDCNTWETETIYCSDAEGGNQTQCSGNQLIIDYSNGPGNYSETEATLMCSCG
jgi:hypothetical protein